MSKFWTIIGLLTLWAILTGCPGTPPANHPKPATCPTCETPQAIQETHDTLVGQANDTIADADNIEKKVGGGESVKWDEVVALAEQIKKRCGLMLAEIEKLLVVKSDVVKANEVYTSNVKIIDDQAVAVDALTKRVATVQKDFDNFKGKWYVRLGVWINRLLWTIIIGFTVSQLFIIASGYFLPLLPVGKFLARLIPFSNVATWLRDLLAAKQGVAPAATVNVNITGAK